MLLDLAHQLVVGSPRPEVATHSGLRSLGIVVLPIASGALRRTQSRLKRLERYQQTSKAARRPSIDAFASTLSPGR